MAAPTHTLTIEDLSEVSFVDFGDNPDAGVLLMKARPPSPLPSPEKPMPDGSTPDDIQKQIDDLVKKNQQQEAALAAFQKREEIGAIEKRIAPHLAPELAADLYAAHKAAPEAAARIEAELIRLAKSAAATQALTTRIGGAGAVAGSVADRLDTLAKARAKEKGVPYHEAYAQITRENPSMYAEYKKEMV